MTTHCPYSGTAQRAGLDHSAGVLRTGYPYFLRLRRATGGAAVETRFLGRRTTVVAGPAGARLFYDESVMRRRGAVPLPLRRVLFGPGAFHGLDDADHKHRKSLFLDLLTPTAARALAATAGDLWREYTGKAVEPAAVFDEAVEVHGAAGRDWAGIRVADAYPRLHQDLIAMVDDFGSFGPRYARAYRARRRCERWARNLVTAVRDGRVRVPGTPLEAIAAYRGRDGEPLPARVAGVELINLLRPTVAVAYFVAFAADALAAGAGLRGRLRDADDAVSESFAHEVRRVYPFVPMLAARVRRPVTFEGRRLPRGRRVLLDVYGTLHDPASWAEPERFDLDRFTGGDPDPYAYVPQGGGDPATGHRCPGERVAIELIKTAARHLVHERPPVANRPDVLLNRIPTRPLAG